MENVKESFKNNLKKSIEAGTFVKLTFGKYKGGDKDFENIFVSRILTKEGEKLSFKFRYKTKDIVKNYDFNAGMKLSEEILGKDFFSGTLFTTEKDFTLDYSKKRIPQMHVKKPVYTSAVNESHNKIKSRFVNEDSRYLQFLGITTSEGKVKADRYDKFRQVDKFIEILDSLYRASDKMPDNEIRISDMGSGKSYLTFAMYDYFSYTLGKKVEIKGIEKREELVKLSEKTASDCGFDGLKFKAGSIENFGEDKTDIAVALHACDTATDDAILKSVKADAKIIIVAPCCQKYVRKKIKIPVHLKGIFKYGIHEERLSAMLTDGLRALTLEYFGYETKVFEFISTDHTAKNTMITAVKKRDIDPGRLVEIEAIKNEFGIDDYYLNKITGIMAV